MTNFYLSCRAQLAALLLFSLLVFSVHDAHAQGSTGPGTTCGGGCTDPASCNYDPNASYDDGSCTPDCIVVANNDVVTITNGIPSPANVLLNDINLVGGDLQVMVLFDNPCLHITAQGELVVNANADCCGPVEIQYMACFQGICDVATVCVEFDCPKPDCTLIDLSEIGGSDDGALGNPGDGSNCITVCENSETTLVFPFTANSTYSWTITGGNCTSGCTTNQITVLWGASGTGAVTVIRTDTLTNLTYTQSYCVEILDGPTAAFTTSATSVCLGSQICVNASPSVNADDFFWDFGDGFTIGGVSTHCHTYNSPGNYIITLTAIKYNYDDAGNPLCCCTDTISTEVFVDSLPGPKIYCISTLCEGDSSKYWTDATNCATYNWTVLDANGLPLPFIGAGNDTICVTWPSGPFGTITLDVSGCDSSYCNSPTTAIVPIISSVSQISGATTVCQGATEFYSVPKWPTVTYLWSSTGGTITVDDSTNTVGINWNTPGTYVITVNYFSSFLSGLPGHEYPDCYGTATLTVTVLPKFDVQLLGSSTVCVGSVSSVQANSPLPFTNYDWTITPSAPFVGDFSPSITVQWNVTPGTYQISASPAVAGVFCNTSDNVFVTVVEQAVPDSITGPGEVCPLDTAYYTAWSSIPGVTFNWSAVNGTPLAFNGTTIGVVWGPSGPYSVSVSQSGSTPPFCTSDTITLNVNQIAINGPMVITGTAACTNAQATYTLSPAQHPDATISWVVSPATSGSVVGGQGTPSATVQWNNDPGIVSVTATVTLCGQTYPVSITDTLYSPIQPVITQIGNLCPGVSATLQVANTFVQYSWNTGSLVNTTSISAAGTYSVTTVDINGCTATDYYDAANIPGPIASISSGNNPTICIDNPHTVIMVAQTGLNYLFEWFCNGVSQGAPSPVATFTHPFQGVPGTYSYVIVVTDQITGCQSTSLPFVVTESDCEPGPPCIPEPYSISINYGLAFPNCNTVNFAFVGTNAIGAGWSFGDGQNGSGVNVSHTYLQAGCYNVIMNAQVPELGNPGFYCSVATDTSVCVPLAVDFDFSIINCTTVQFNEYGTWIPGAGNAITTWAWNFGVGTSNALNPAFTFPGPGVWPVTLTVYNSNGCQASITYNVTIGSVGVPTVTAAPTLTWVGFPVNFTASAANAVSYFWDFDDGATFTGATPSHSYIAPGAYWVSATASDAQGCTQVDSVLVNVLPAVPVQPITHTGLTICQGQTTTLTAPAGYTYLWSNGAVTQSITVGAGTYSVLITDANGCPLQLDPVEVIEIPAPNVVITGNPYLCDSDCQFLQVAYDPTNTYQWLDNTGSPIPGETFSSIYVCANTLLPGYQVLVTNQYGCSDTSAVFVVTAAISPSFSVVVTGSGCQGDPNVLTVTPVQPNVVYTWSNGDQGITTTVFNAGVYTVFGLDTISGCSGVANATINPLPDLCIVPFGCYEACNPDTICGPNGMQSYQWNFNGAPLPGATNQCLEVTLSGSYSLTATNSNGCSATSDSLILHMIDCNNPCDSLELSYSYLTDADGNIDSCCVTIHYYNGLGDILGINIHTDDTDLIIDPSSVNALLGINSIGTQHISLVSNTPGDPIPAGYLDNVVTICAGNNVNDPQYIIIDWYETDTTIICSDTIVLHCPVEPDCLYLAEDSIYCVDQGVVYQITVCNPADADFSVGYIDLNAITPTGIVLSPADIDITGTPIAPGTCQTFTIQLSGPGIEGQTFCYQMIAHESNPELVDTVVCCSLDTLYCIDIPICDPCDLVWAEGATPSGSDDGCCYNVALYNGFGPGYFDEIGVSMISPGTTMTVNNPFGSGWTTSGYTPTAFSLIPGPLFGNYVPAGAFTLPEICLQTTVAPNQLIEIQWMQNGNIICRDTVEMFCEPDCGYFFDEVIECDPTTGTWLYSVMVKNTAPYTINQVHVSYTSPAGMSAWNSVVVIPGGLPSNSTYGPISFNIGAPAAAGDTVCFVVTLHEVTPDSTFLSCCNFNHCIELPECPFDLPCVCNEEFFIAVNAGFTVTPTSVTNEYIFSMVQSNFFSDCDNFVWSFGDASANLIGPGLTDVVHMFPGPGVYQVCVRVTRIADDGTVCKRMFCTTVTVMGGLAPQLTMYPNPTEGKFNLSMKDMNPAEMEIMVLDNLSQPVFCPMKISSQNTQLLEIDLSDQAKGVYFVRVLYRGETVVQKIVVY